MSILTKLLFYFYILIIQVNSILISLSNDMLDVKEDSYKIENKILSIMKNGEYEISGTCSECQISIDKSLIVDLTINSIAIDNSNTGPFVIKKEAKINLILKGDSYILDNELSSNEDEDDFEGAGIKFKSSSSLTISGDGKLTVFGKTKME